MKLIIFVGLQASGKSTFFHERFAGTHEHVSKDLFRHNRNRNRRQTQLMEAALEAGRSVVVDNTNPAPEDRRPLIELGRRYGAKVAGYYFGASARECLQRNARREGRARVPDVAIYATAKKLVPPSPEEGFDELYRVHPIRSGFEVRAVYPPAGRGRVPRRFAREKRGANMATSGQEILKEHYNDDHLTHEEIEALDLRVVTEGGETVPDEEARGKIFRIVDRDEPSGYLVRSMETTGQQTTLCYLQPAP